MASRGSVELRPYEYSDQKIPDVYASVSGLPFHAADGGDGWIDKGSRSNGYASGDLIYQPAYIIESIIRDWVCRENDLVCSAFDTTSEYIDFNDTTNNIGLLGAKYDNYYNSAYLHHPDPDLDWIKTVSDYTGSSRRCTVASLTAAEMNVTEADNVMFLTNVGDKIDTTSFDLVGNTSDGIRDDWVFARIIDEEITAADLLNETCFESFTLLFNSQGLYKLVALYPATALVTWTNPIYIEGIPQAYVRYSDNENIYTDITLNCCYDKARGRYLRTEFCNRNSSSDATYLTKTYRDILKDASERWLSGGERKLIINSKWLQDEYTTRIALLQNLIKWFARKKVIVEWTSGLKDYIQYELGDIVLINNTYILPTGINNTSKFMIFKKDIDIQNHLINWNLIEIPSDM